MMNPKARRQFYKLSARERARILGEQKVQQHLQAAVKALRYGPEVFHLSADRQIEILEEYAEHLEVEIYDFEARWGADGKDGVLSMRFERRGVLDAIAHLKIKRLRGDDDGHRRVNAAGR